MASIPQSPFQTTIQNQVGTQSVAQSGVPSAVNNGNPNTVYNVAAQPAPWQTGTQPVPMPMTTAGGQWYIPTSTATPLPWSPPKAQTVAQQQIVIPEPNFQGAGGWPVTPPTTGGPNPPVPTGGGGGGGGAGLGGGGTGKPFNPLDPRNNGNYTPGQPGWRSLLEGGGIPVGPQGSQSWNRAVQWSNAVFDRLGGAKLPNGNWDWKQIVDMVTEPLLGGNLWLSGSQKWDASNGVASLVQAVTGIPLGNIMNKLGEWQATQSDPADTWLEKMLADHWEDNANNEIKVFQDTLNRYLGNYATHQVNNINNQNTNANINWMNRYTDALANAMLSGLKGQAASDAARKAADAGGRDTSGPTGGEPRGGGGGGWDGRLGAGVTAYGGGCVVVDNIIDGYNRADEVRVDDLMNVVDAQTFARKLAHVSQAIVVTRPCVRLQTEHGVVLECSIDAEIADDKGNRVLAEDLMGVKVPSMIDGQKVDDVVVKVESIGERPVMKITAENNWYLAGKEKGKYLLHHNVKFYNEYGNRTSSSGWQGSGSITPNGLLWGW